MTDHPDYWNAFYDDDARPAWDMAKPTPVLAEALAEARALGLAPGASIVVPGCGYGHDAAGLAAEGFRVTGLDFAPLALQGARARYGDRITWSSADWFSPQLGPWDAIFDHTCFAAVEPARRPAYVEACARHLAPGGFWLAVLFHDVQGRPAPPHAISMETCRALAEPRFEILHLVHTTNSHPRRAEREFLMVAKRRQD
jgi:SAM-dependent methyltransferase